MVFACMSVLMVTSHGYADYRDALLLCLALCQEVHHLNCYLLLVALHHHILFFRLVFLSSILSIRFSTFILPSLMSQCIRRPSVLLSPLGKSVKNGSKSWVHLTGRARRADPWQTLDRLMVFARHNDTYDVSWLAWPLSHWRYKYSPTAIVVDIGLYFYLFTSIFFLLLTDEQKRRRRMRWRTRNRKRRE